jgi:predicted transcriptional regulator
MCRDLTTVPAWLSLDEAARRYGENPGSMCLFVTENERVLGVLCQEQLRAVPRGRWQDVTVREAMRPSADVSTVDRWADCAAMVQTMEAEELRHLPVVEQGKLVALVSREAILRLLLAQRVLR